MTRGVAFQNYSITAKVPCGEIKIFLNIDENGKLYQTHVYLNKSFKNVNCMKTNLEAVSRLVSLGIKHGIPIQKLLAELKHNDCLERAGPSKYKSCVDAYAKAIEDFLSGNKRGDKIEDNNKEEEEDEPTCSCT